MDITKSQNIRDLIRLSEFDHVLTPQARGKKSVLKFDLHGCDPATGVSLLTRLKGEVMKAYPEAQLEFQHETRSTGGNFARRVSAGSGVLSAETGNVSELVITLDNLHGHDLVGRLTEVYFDMQKKNEFAAAAPSRAS